MSVAVWSLVVSALAVVASGGSVWFAYRAREAATQAARMAEAAAQWTTHVGGPGRPQTSEEPKP